MSKKVKGLITQEYAGSYEGVENACVVSVIGLDAISTNQLRGKLGAKNIKLRVVKNSLARRAFGEGPLGPLARAMEGPCALAVGGDSVIDVAKTLVDMKKEYPQIELKMGMIEGDPDLVEVAQLAKMKGKAELLADVAGCLIAPAGKLAGCLQSPGGRLAGCFKAMAEKEDAA